MKLVLTGGPSGGKTTMAMAIVKAFGSKVVMVPESASILFTGGFRRREDAFGIRHQQKAIYHVQAEHEAIFTHEYNERLLVCDRGTLDGLAYWPGSEQEFFDSIGSSRELELRRYDYVFHLDTADGGDYNSNRNPIRNETHSEALNVNQRVLSAWEGHPRRLIVPSMRTFGQKMAIILTAAEKIINGEPFASVCESVHCV